MAADSGQKNIQIVGTASMNTYDVALRVGKQSSLCVMERPERWCGNLIGSMTCKVGVSKKITAKQARRTEICLRSWKETIMPPFTGEEK